MLQDLDSPASESSDGQPIECTGNSTKKLNRSYGSGARKRHQLRTTDLIPKRALTFSLLIGAMLITATLISLLRWFGNDLLGSSLPAKVAVGSTINELVQWLCNVLLIVCAVLSLQVYALRKHNSDDYYGSYRLWLWISGGLFVASAFCVVDLATLFGALLHQTTDWTIFRQGSLFWLALQLVLLSAIAARIIYEVRQSVVAVVSLSTAATLLVATTLYNHDWFRNQFIGELHALCDTGLLWSVLSLMIGITSFARFVYLDAHSLIKRQPNVEAVRTRRKPKTKSKTRSARSEQSTSRRSTSTQVASSQAASKQPASTVASNSPKTSKDTATSIKKKRFFNFWNRRSKAESDGSEKQASKSTTSTSSKSKAVNGRASVESLRSASNSDANSAAAKSRTTNRLLNREDSRESGNSIEADEPNVIRLSEADRRLLETSEENPQLLSKSDRRRLKKLQKRGKQAA